MFLGLGWNVWAAIIGAAAFAVWQFWPSLEGLFGKFKWPSSPTKTAPSRAKAVEAVDYLLTFFKECPAGMKAARECGQHLFDEHTGGV